MPKPDLTLRPEDIDWRVGATFDAKGVKHGTMLGYIDSRTAMEKLDMLDEHWSSRMEPVTLGPDAGIRCTLTVNGVSREDVGIASAQEPLKGAFSDALKRAAVHFGIGRELYDLPHIAVQVEVKANGKVGRPLALPVWKNGRWTIDPKYGWVKYDREPAEQPARSAPASAPSPRERLIDAATAHSVDAAGLERLAKRVGVPSGQHADDAQIEQIIALIETLGQSEIQPPPAAMVDPILDAVLAQTGGTVEPEKPEYIQRAEARAAAAKAAPRGARETPEPIGMGLEA